MDVELREASLIGGNPIRGLPVDLRGRRVGESIRSMAAGFDRLEQLDRGTDVGIEHRPRSLVEVLRAIDGPIMQDQVGARLLDQGRDGLHIRAEVEGLESEGWVLGHVLWSPTEQVVQTGDLPPAIETGICEV